MHVLEQIAGVLLVALVLSDLFLTVLYARIGRGPLSRFGTGIISAVVARMTFRAFRRVANHCRPNTRGSILAFCGPVVVLALIASWAGSLAVGAALIIHPALGTAMVTTPGPTPTDFATALYAGATSITILTAGSVTPVTAGMRLACVALGLVGTAVISLTLTYVLQIYNALQRRNTLGLKIHLLAAETDDAAELVAGVGPQGRFDVGFTLLAEMAAEMAAVKESHHFYPVLFYFRFRDVHYSVSKFVLIALDAISLMKSALDDEEHGWLKESGPVAQLWRASLMFVETLESTFVAGEPSERIAPHAEERWRVRWFAARERLEQAGIATMQDDALGLETYLRLRARWEARLTSLAREMGIGVEELDPVGRDPALVDGRRDFRARLHSIA